MTKQVKKQTKTKQSNHTFKNCRDAFLIPAARVGTSSNILLATTDANGNGNFATVLAPLGLTSSTLGASSYSAGTLGNMLGPPLRGLYNKAVDFQWYRVTRAKFVFVGNVGSTTTGNITLAAYTDPTDVTATPSAAYSSGRSNRTFDLASSSNRELSVPVPVDSAWKKVSSLLNEPGNIYPFTAASAGTLAIINTVSDLSFGSVTYLITGAPASATNLGSCFLDYDIEFKGVVDASINS